MENNNVQKTVKDNYDFLDNQPKKYYQVNKEKNKKDHKSIKELFQKMKTLKKEIMLTSEIKACQA